MKRISTFGMLCAFLLALIPFVAPTAAEAQVTPTCTNYQTYNPAELDHTYPNDGHFFVCFVGADLNKTTKIFGAVKGLPAKLHPQDPDQVRDLLQSKNEKYYYFATRGDANLYFKNTLPYRLVQTDGVFQSTTSRCGQTGYTVGGTLASAIYETCQLNGTKILTNPNVQGVTLHETGHAFDFALALASSNPSVPRSQSVGYKGMVFGFSSDQNHRSDLPALDLGRTGHPAVGACATYKTTAPSALEVDLGKFTAVASGVCTAGGVINQPFVGLSNSEILIKQDPYFVQPTPSSLDYSELFAEEFAVRTGRINTPAPVPFLDSMMGLLCSNQAVNAFYNTLQPPTTLILNQNFCPAAIPSDFNTR